MSEDTDGLDVRSLAATFRAGGQIQAHRHRWGQLVYVASGAMRVADDGNAWLTPPTRALWMPAGIAHRLSAVGAEVALRTLYIAPARAATLPAAPTVVEVSPLLRELILHILRLGMLAPSNPVHDRLAAVLVDLVATAPCIDTRLPLPVDSRARKLAERLLARPGDRTGLEGLAAEVGASLRTLQRLFPRDTGLTIEGWRHKAALVHAAARLADGASVADAALESGWQSTTAFVAAFRQAFGLTPGRYARA